MVMGMARLIDADAIKYWEHTQCHGHGYFITERTVTAEQIAKMPTIDAVPVVRCKDCKHRGDDVHGPMCFEEMSEYDDGDGYMEVDYIPHDRTTDDGFCDRGERRTDNENP